ncbi:MAG: biopolymer transporter ExbD [Holosporaceae bacterium]|jgi:biopolymer transport protein TolR|nr:biopolymer transporter ExbD [Holosporaceae bacterium]
MAFVVPKTKKKSARPLMSDMNVTPMIDVMLVLLVIFMVTAPLLSVGVKVNLPSANAPNITGNETPIMVHVDGNGRVFIGEIEVDLETLPAKLQAITGENSAAAKIFVRADKSLPYGAVMEVMGSISSSGFKNVVLVTELPKKSKQRPNASKKI